MRFYDVYDVSDCSPSCDARIPLSCLTAQFLWHFPCKIQAENEYSFIEVKQMEQNVNDITCTHRLSERENANMRRVPPHQEFPEHNIQCCLYVRLVREPYSFWQWNALQSFTEDFTKLSRIQARTAGSSLSKDCAFTHLSLPLNGFHSLYSERRVPTHSLHYQSRLISRKLLLSSSGHIPLAEQSFITR
ncbi:hypothetical protein T4D_4601 [Trichinella pseudospiralis]|uniref:Uncharacterized protein n=1 Tax=Trichinella pseudospiralis TaxID=6337 RepID=A0A0V1FYQ6_TRIPS|nr:hypothetical protein T4D_4601 [Trichinella pseudospiralis]